MADLISRSAALDAIFGCFNVMESKGIDMTVARTIVKGVLDETPIINAIPTEKYKAEIETLRLRCAPGAEDAFVRKAYGCLKIVPVSYGTKVVDAIPVGWLEKQASKQGPYSVYCQAALEILLNDWQKEQEAKPWEKS